jgi:hypothetical protein
MAVVLNRVCHYCGEEIRNGDAWVEASHDKVYCCVRHEYLDMGYISCHICGEWHPPGYFQLDPSRAPICELCKKEINK